MFVYLFALQLSKMPTFLKGLSKRVDSIHSLLIRDSESNLYSSLYLPVQCFIFVFSSSCFVYLPVACELCFEWVITLCWHREVILWSREKEEEKGYLQSAKLKDTHEKWRNEEIKKKRKIMAVGEWLNSEYFDRNRLCRPGYLLFFIIIALFSFARSLLPAKGNIWQISLRPLLSSSLSAWDWLFSSSF